MNESDDDKQATNWMVEIGGSRIPFQDISEEMLQTTALGRLGKIPHTMWTYCFYIAIED